MPDFNPHGDKTSNGITIVLGLRVKDYDWKIGRVVGDYDTTTHEIRGDQCPGDHWFKIEREDGSTSMMNGTRLLAL